MRELTVLLKVSTSPKNMPLMLNVQPFFASYEIYTPKVKRRSMRLEFVAKSCRWRKEDVATSADAIMSGIGI